MTPSTSRLSRCAGLPGASRGPHPQEAVLKDPPHPLPQIKLGLLAAFGEQAAAQRDIDPALLAAMVSLAAVAPTPGGPEAYIADYARKYM